jgi:hypothetical protein
MHISSNNYEQLRKDRKTEFSAHEENGIRHRKLRISIVLPGFCACGVKHSAFIRAGNILTSFLNIGSSWNGRMPLLT